MKTTNYRIYAISVGATCLLVVSLYLLASPVAAQNNLQSANSGLQPQSSQTQSSVNTQNQTRNVQTNNSQDALNKNSPKALGVVSDPKQTVPDAVVTPSDTLKTDLTKRSGSNYTPLIAFILLSVSTLAYYLSRRKDSVVATVETEVITPKTKQKQATPEPIKVPKKKKSTKSSRKKRKQTQR